MNTTSFTKALSAIEQWLLPIASQLKHTPKLVLDNKAAAITFREDDTVTIGAYFGTFGWRTQQIKGQAVWTREDTLPLPSQVSVELRIERSALGPDPVLHRFVKQDEWPSVFQVKDEAEDVLQTLS